MALDPRVSGALRLPAPGVILTGVVLYLLAGITVSRWSKRAGWGSTHRFALAVGAALTYTWCGLVFAGHDVLDLVGQGVVALLAVGILALAARRTRVALPPTVAAAGMPASPWRISTTVIGLVGEQARACVEALDRASNIRAELPDPDAPPLDRAAASWGATRRHWYLGLLHRADVDRVVPDQV